MAKRSGTVTDLPAVSAMARASASDPWRLLPPGTWRAARRTGRRRAGTCGAFTGKSARHRSYSGRKSTERTSARLAAARFLDLPAVYAQPLALLIKVLVAADLGPRHIVDRRTRI